MKKYVKKVNTTIVGISAGSINAANIVYNSPECKEDKLKSEILIGLNLTNINIELDFAINNDNIRMNSILEQSYKRVIYGLPDGSYIKNNILYGKGYPICNVMGRLKCLIKIKKNV